MQCSPWGLNRRIATWVLPGDITCYVQEVQVTYRQSGVSVNFDNFICCRCNTMHESQDCFLFTFLKNTAVKRHQAPTFFDFIQRGLSFHSFVEIDKRWVWW